MVLNRSEGVHRISHGGVDDANGASLDPPTAVQTHYRVTGRRVLHYTKLVGDNVALRVEGDTRHGQTLVPNAFYQDVAFQVLVHWVVWLFGAHGLLVFGIPCEPHALQLDTSESVPFLVELSGAP